MDIKIMCTKKELARIIRTCGACACDDACIGCVIGAMCGECDGIEDVVDFEIVGEPCDG